MSRHLIAKIEDGSKYDVLLTVLLGYAGNWRDRDPETCSREWVPAMELLQALWARSMWSLSLGTDISTCRAHLEKLYPQWTIANKLDWRPASADGPGKRLSSYKIVRVRDRMILPHEQRDKVDRMVDLIKPMWTSAQAEQLELAGMKASEREMVAPTPERHWDKTRREYVYG